MMLYDMMRFVKPLQNVVYTQPKIRIAYISSCTGSESVSLTSFSYVVLKATY